MENSQAQGLDSKVLALEKQILALEQKYQVLLTSAGGIKSDVDEEKTTEEKPKPLDTVGNDPKPDVEKDENRNYPRVKIIKTVKDPDTGERREVQDDSKQPKRDENDEFAFTIKKIVNDKFMAGEDDNSEIDINSLDLWDLLKEHLSDYPYHIFRGSPVTLSSPYEPIIFGWEALEKAASERPENLDDRGKQAREDLQDLLAHISGGASGDAQLDKYFKVRGLYQADKTVQFEDLWTIFPPGTLVYGKPFQNQEQVFLVRDNQMTWPERGERTQQWVPWKLSCWTYDWTGERFQRTCFTLVFEQFEGHRPLTALPYFPLELKRATDKKIDERLIERGEKFRKFCTADEGKRLFEYEGDSMFGRKGFPGLMRGDDDEDTLSRASFREIDRILYGRRRYTAEPAIVTPSFYVNSRVMVDYLSYFQYGPSNIRNGNLDVNSNDPDCMCPDCKINSGLQAKYRIRFDMPELQKKEKWEDEQYILCPPRVLGYILKDKQWAQLQVSLLKPIEPDSKNSAWKSRLQLADGGIKDTLFDLVSSHISSASLSPRKPEPEDLEVNDIIPGKGKGLVILLYGPPGVGKTSTAETIAVATGKPLFSVSVSDVGTQARNVETNLSKIFSLAAAWQAILLIDEADVFLESRSRGPTASTDRNALVSVFLRVLEYYQGIMFLTTNQIAQFDVAIPSRIHISIQYQSLQRSQMERIFRGFLEPLEGKNLIENYKGILEWLEEDVYDIGMDGRQIRNVVTTALGLARAETKYRNGDGKLTKKHLKAIVNNVSAFKRDFAVQYDRYVHNQEKLIK